jgi:hypothetical protein
MPIGCSSPPEPILDNGSRGFEADHPDHVNCQGG